MANFQVVIRNILRIKHIVSLKYKVFFLSLEALPMFFTFSEKKRNICYFEEILCFYSGLYMYYVHKISILI